MSFTFPELPYAYDALEPHFDALTMEIHYSRHHKTYFDKFVAAIEGTDLADKSLEDIFSGISSQSAAVRNNGGGYYNHIIFWNSVSPNGGGEPTGELGDAIVAKWGSFENFKEEFSAGGVARFGSGFVWLIVNKAGELEITHTANQDNPLMDTEASQGTPILAMDVWEHAYYLKYQNKRPDYIAAFWNIANWDYAAAEYAKLK